MENGGVLGRVADATTGAPDGGSGDTFESFGIRPSVDGSEVAFFAETTSGRRGVFTSAGGPQRTVADDGAPTPTGPGRFSFPSSREPALADGVVVFGAEDDSLLRPGVFQDAGGVLSARVEPDAAVPGGAGSFLEIYDVSFDGGNIAFSGISPGGQGVYTGLGGPLRVVGDQDTAVPGRAAFFSDLAFPEFRDGGYGCNTRLRRLDHPPAPGVEPST